jgi:hypothetical protein
VVTLGMISHRFSASEHFKQPFRTVGSPGESAQ